MKVGWEEQRGFTYFRLEGGTGRRVGSGSFIECPTQTDITMYNYPLLCRPDVDVKR